MLSQASSFAQTVPKFIPTKIAMNFLRFTMLVFSFLIMILYSKVYAQKTYDIKSACIKYKISNVNTNETIILSMQFQEYGKYTLLEWSVPTQKRQKYLKTDTLQYSFQADSLITTEKRMEHFSFESLSFQNLHHWRDTTQQILLNKKRSVKLKHLDIIATEYVHFFWHRDRGNVTLYQGIPLAIRIRDFALYTISFTTDTPEIDAMLKKLNLEK